MKTRTLLALMGALFVGATLFATPTAENTPDKFVRYVEATGSQYVDTGIVGRYGTKAECKVEWMAFSDSSFLASRTGWGDSRLYFCYCLDANGNMFTAQGKGANVNNGQDLCFEKKRIYTYTSEFSAVDDNNMSTNTITIDGTKVFTKASTALDTARNLYVFALNVNNTVNAKSKTRCYGLKIWQDGTLVRDFKPCLKDNRAGLYDAVSDTIFYSESGTDLTYDTNCDVPDAFIDYVESFGNSYIDTGITGRSGTKAECKVQWMAFADSAFLACGDWSQSTRFFVCYCRNASGIISTAQRTLANVSSGGKDLTYELNRIYTYTSDFAAPDGNDDSVNTVSIDGSEVFSRTTKSLDTGLNLYVFACNQKANTLIGKSKTRCYGLKIWQDGGLVRDFKPCLKYGEAALYDDVTKTIFYPEGDPLGYDNSVAASPDEVVYVDYIESDGFTHLDTQVAANSPTRATGTFSWTQMRSTTEEAKYLDENHHSYLACGCYNSSSDANRFYLIDQTSQKPWIGYGNNTKSFGSAMATGTKYDFDVSFAAGAQAYSQTPEGGSATTSNTEWSGDADGQGSLYLFACNDAKNGKPIYQSAARCYGLTIYQAGETPVRNFKPCVKDGQAALYDTVSQRIFYPVPAIPAEGNTGAITEESALSPVEAYLEYVETDKTQYIDTGVVGKAGTTAEFVETSLCDNQDVEECFLGSVTASWQTERFYMWYHRTKFALGLGYGSEYWTPSLKDPTAKVSDWNPATNSDAYPLSNGTKTHARVSFAAGSQRMVVVNDATGAGTVVADRALADDIDTGRNLYLFANNNNGTAASFAKSRLYWLKIKQDGAYVRKFQPVRLKNGLVGLWDFVEEKTYLPKTSTGGLPYFSAVGQETGKLFNKRFVIIVR